MQMSEPHPFTLGFCGYSGSGKTTLIEKLVAHLSLDYAIGYLKHDAHHFEMDTPGKDTDRARQAGVTSVVIQNEEHSACLIQGKIRPEQLRASFMNAELVLVEGYKQAPWDKILVLDSELKILAELTDGSIQDVQAFVGPWEQAPKQLPEKIPYFQRDHLDGIMALIRQWMSHERPALYGLLMMGGQSQRMLSDKAWLDYHGKPQFQASYELLQGLCEQVYLSVRPDQDLAAIQQVLPDAPLIQDRLIGFGPLGGLLSAQIAKPHIAWLVLACDLPQMDLKSLHMLCFQRQKSVTSFISPHDGKSEPLCAIYEPETHLAALSRLQSGHHCLRKLIKQVPHHLIEAPEPHVLANANTPHDYQHIKALLAKKGNNSL